MQQPPTDESSFVKWAVEAKKRAMNSMARTEKYHKLCHPFREELKKGKKEKVKRFRKKEKQTFKKTAEPLVKPKDIWKDYGGKPNQATKTARTRANFQED
jgi:hypothetical protein